MAIWQQAARGGSILQCIQAELMFFLAGKTGGLKTALAALVLRWFCFSGRCRPVAAVAALELQLHSLGLGFLLGRCRRLLDICHWLAQNHASCWDFHMILEDWNGGRSLLDGDPLHVREARLAWLAPVPWHNAALVHVLLPAGDRPLCTEG